MIIYLLKRIAGAAVVLWAIITITFGLMHAIPLARLHGKEAAAGRHGKHRSPIPSERPALEAVCRLRQPGRRIGFGPVL